MLDLYTNIKIKREELGMSQEELAQKTGYTSRSSIAKIEKGLVDLPQTKIESFAEALKTTPQELLGWDVGEDKNIVIFDYEFENATNIIERAGYLLSFSQPPNDNVLIVKNKANSVVATIEDHELVNKYRSLQHKGLVTAELLLGLDKDPEGFSKIYSIPKPGSAKYVFSDIDNRLVDIVYGYQKLNESGKEKAYDYVMDLSEQQKYIKQPEHLIPNAAHQRTDLSNDELDDKARNKHDDDIMDDPNF